ncbi:4-hydroxy-tetrahydrodipicolinate synthase, chloroplastic-like [Lotus japonicus]|uniref:4-hydroxy-tetrahydrodipicolinate synthase, chloroplastic-like n=1 Tax=Lotus japonicus TaxID=34305 RepID=UPI0025897FC3|nr:4-hydroxy-tetrahydrodipicolinate synthase, chloroplastic-like [Lotus japonicus]
MTMLKGDCSSFLLRQPGSHFFSSITSNGNRKNTYWKPPQAAERLDSHLPMSSSVIQNRASMEDLRSLRFATAVKTPYLPNGRFDLETYDNLVNMQISNGVEGILVAGTTGEGYLMTWDDQISLIAHTVQSFGDKVQVIGNSGSNCTSEAIKATERGFAAGMDVSLQINPYYGKTSTDGLVAHYNSVLSIGPVIIYNVPTRTSSDIPPSVIEILAQNPNLVGVKECVGNDRVKKYTNEGLVVWTGNDEESHEARWECGATGVHSVAGNLVPGLIRKLMFEGKNPSLNSKLMPLFDWLFHVPVPVALNTALAQLGVIKPVFRLPHVPVPVEKRVEFVNLVKEIGREHFVGDKDVQVLDNDDFILVSRY